MTVATTDNEVNHVGDGAITLFTFNYVTLDVAHIEVYLEGVKQSSGFTTVLNADQDTSPGGNVTFTSPPGSGIAIALIREVPYTQETDYTAYDAFPALAHETALDKLTMLIQQGAGSGSDAVKFPVSDPVLSKYLPDAASRANKAFHFDASGEIVMAVPSTVVDPSIQVISDIDSIATLRSLDTTALSFPATKVLLSGYYAAGDGGGGMFYWDSASTETDNNGTIIKATATATGRWKRSYSGAVSVKWFGAKGDNSNDDTSAIQSALDIFAVNYGTICFPIGIYKVTSTVTISNNRQHLIGAGGWATVISFEPTANDTCFLIENGSAVSYQGSIKGFTFDSPDTTYVKIAVNFIDCSGWGFEDINSLTWSDTSFSSTLLKISGREAISVKRMYTKADKNVVLAPILAPHTASGIGCDHMAFHDCYWLAASNNAPIFTIETGTIVTQLSFTGFQAWVEGSYGLYWNDTTSTIASNGINMNNVRWENGVNEFIYIVNNITFQGLQINGGQAEEGVYLRNVHNVKFDSFYMTSAAAVALDVDATVKRISGVNCFWQAGSTANIVGQRTTFAAPKNPTTGALPPSFIFDEEINGATVTQLGPVIESLSFTLADNAIQEIPAWVSMIFITDNIYGGQFISKGSTGGVVEISDWGLVYTVAKGTATQTNVYYEAGKYYIENKRGSSQDYSVTIICH